MMIPVYPSNSYGGGGGGVYLGKDMSVQACIDHNVFSF